MLMDVKCSAVTSIKVDLTYDDHSKKEQVVSIGDLVDVVYNANGMRKRAEGKVIKISAVGVDPAGWYIIVDGSDDFSANKARFSPMSILDLDIIRKADSLDVIRTPLGHESVPYLRIIKGRLQWSKDGFDWKPINIDQRDIIEDASGYIPEDNGEDIDPIPPRPIPYNNDEEYDDEIQESNY